jgi:formylglycine-generating enzyme required for sulfatase activity
MSFIFSMKDGLRQSVEAATGGHQTVLYNAAGLPGYYFVLPKFRYEDLGLDSVLGTGVCTAFSIGGVEKDEIFIGAYPAVVKDGYALSLPGMDPTTSVTFDQSRTYAEANGPGFHLMTMHEWAAIALWCKANGFEPRGNSDYGRAHDAHYEFGRRQDGESPGVSSGTARTLNGSGPASWRHNNHISGIADIVGNVWKWMDLLKIVDGQILTTADNDYDAAESAWISTGIYFDGQDLATSVSNPTYNSSDTWVNTAIGSGLDADNLKLIKRLCVAPVTETALQGRLYINDDGERLPRRGGYWGSGSSVGLGSLYLYSVRSSSNSSVGFFPAFAN